MKSRYISVMLFFVAALASIESSAQIIILPTATPTPLPTSTPNRDFNKDGLVDAKDLLTFIQGWHGGTAGDKITVDIPNLQSGAIPLRLVRVRGGIFQMGSPGGERGRESQEGPIHLVNIEKDFYLGEAEITQGQWEAITGKNIGDQRNLANPSFDIYTIGKDIPIYYLSWNDAQDFINGLNALGQGTFRFPSEAEWEYACRGGANTRFHFGSFLDCEDTCVDCQENLIFTDTRSDYMWYCSTDGINGFQRGPKQVATLLPNPFGLYDMHGNVLEFCQDWYHFGYNGAPNDGSAWEDPAGSQRIYRGGHSFAHAGRCRSAWRGAFVPSERYVYAGLRVAMDATE